MVIKITVEYFGRNYSGWQRQKNAPSVQEILEEKLSILVQERVTLAGSGRTDAGVHAEGQVASFEIKKDFPVEKMAYAVNTMLPSDIRVRSAEIAPDGFHAQYTAKLKTYRYSLYIDRISHPVKDLTSAQIPYDEKKLNFSLMQEAAKDYLGTHDFIAFRSTGSDKRCAVPKTTVRTVTRAAIEKNGQDITFTVTGNGFLYNMVRIMAGTLVWIGLGKLPPDAIKQALTTGERIKAGKTFPPHGLTLVSVEY
jgi:tRNA pseudouridine38-40 synthase